MSLIIFRISFNIAKYNIVFVKCSITCACKDQVHKIKFYFKCTSLEYSLIYTYKELDFFYIICNIFNSSITTTEILQNQFMNAHFIFLVSPDV